MKSGFYWREECQDLAQLQEGDERSWVAIDGGRIRHDWLGEGGQYFHEEKFTFVLPEEYLL